MKDIKDALCCMGQMADKCLTSLGAIQKDHNEFVSLVKRMRDAQKALYDIPYKTLGETELCQVRAWSFEKEVDDYLKKIETCD